MNTASDDIPNDLETLKAAYLTERARRLEAEAEALLAKAQVANAEVVITHLKLMIAKLNHAKYGPSAERSRKLLDQLELQLEELEANATEDEAVALAATPDQSKVAAFTRKKPVRAPFPAHLPRERVVIPGPTSCPCCQGKLVKLGETITESMESIPRQWKVIQTVREKFSCRGCEAITQPPAPFYPIARGRAGPNLLAMILASKFANHMPLNRQSEIYAREGIDLDVSTMGDWIGACAFTLAPLIELIRRHVLAAMRIHGDDTTVPVLAPGRTATGRLWTYVRDDRPFGGPAPPAAVFYYSRDRTGAHPQAHLANYTGILQADAYGGYGQLYQPVRTPGPITEAPCWAHARRNFFKLADLGKYPLAFAAVKRIDAIFEIERAINGVPAEQRREVRQARAAPLVEELNDWMTAERAKLSRGNDVAKAMDYMLKRWAAFTRFIDDGRICLSNNAAERELRAVAVGRKNWMFAGSDRGGERAAAIYTLVATAKLNDIDPEAWLADVLRRINDHPASRLDELLPWNWRKPERQTAVAA